MGVSRSRRLRHRRRRVESRYADTGILIRCGSRCHMRRGSAVRCRIVLHVRSLGYRTPWCACRIEIDTCCGVDAHGCYCCCCCDSSIAMTTCYRRRREFAMAISLRRRGMSISAEGLMKRRRRRRLSHSSSGICYHHRWYRAVVAPCIPMLFFTRTPLLLSRSRRLSGPTVVRTSIMS